MEALAFAAGVADGVGLIVVPVIIAVCVLAALLEITS